MANLSFQAYGHLEPVLSQDGAKAAGLGALFEKAFLE